MWQPFINATLKYVPDGREKIVFDRYHIVAYLNRAVDFVRRRENVPSKRQDEFASLIRLGLKVGRAWAIKEMLRELWQHADPQQARRFWERWHSWASRCSPC
jgi:transposase